MSEQDITDIGVNFDGKKFHNQHDIIMENAKKAGVKSIISISNSSKEGYANIKYCQKYNQVPKLYCTVGIHPHNAKELNSNSISKLKELIIKNKEYVVAVGECGLDYNRMFSPQDIQKKCFEEQIKLALELNLPLYFHERDSFDDFYEIAKKYDLKEKGVIHCFTGTKKELLAYLDLGFYIGITGWVCDDIRGKVLQSIIPKIPLDRILLETDSPFLTPKNIYPKPNFNEPKNVIEVIKKVASIMKISEDDLIKNAAENRKRLFGF